MLAKVSAPRLKWRSDGRRGAREATTSLKAEPGLCLSKRSGEGTTHLSSGRPARTAARLGHRKPLGQPRSLCRFATCLHPRTAPQRVSTSSTPQLLREYTAATHSPMMMTESRYTSVMRSTRSGNYYNVPISADVVSSRELAPEMSTFANYDGFEYEVVAAAWGTTTMRRLPAVAKRRDLNAALDGMAPSKDPHTFQPAFAFDLNQLVASLSKGSAGSSHNSSFTSTRSNREPMPEPAPETSRISVLPEVAPRQRRRRGALSGEDELARSYAPAPPANSIIAYSLNKRKQKRLAAKALAAASVNGPNFEVAVADAGNEHQPQYVPRYMPQYQADVTSSPPSSRNREPSLDQQSYAL